MEKARSTLAKRCYEDIALATRHACTALYKHAKARHIIEGRGRTLAGTLEECGDQNMLHSQMTNQCSIGSQASHAATDLEHPVSKIVRRQTRRSTLCLHVLTEQFLDETLQLHAGVTKHARVLV